MSVIYTYLLRPFAAQYTDNPNADLTNKTLITKDEYLMLYNFFSAPDIILDYDEIKYLADKKLLEYRKCDAR